MTNIIKHSGHDPFAEMEAMIRKMTGMRGGFTPAMDVYETEDAVVVEAPLVGIKPEDVEINIENGVLSVRGESKKEHEVDDKNYYRKEIRSGSFHRRVALPNTVKEDEVSAEYEDGILKITAPKAAEPEKKRITVEIKKKHS